MAGSAPEAVYHEELPLGPREGFIFSVEVSRLGVEPALLELLNATLTDEQGDGHEESYRT